MNLIDVSSRLILALIAVIIGLSAGLIVVYRVIKRQRESENFDEEIKEIEGKSDAEGIYTHLGQNPQ